MVIFIIAVYALIGLYVGRDFIKGLQIHKARFTGFRYGLPVFTIRARNGRFTGNRVSFWTVATH